MPIRYAMFVVLAHFGLFLLALPYLQKVWDKDDRRALAAFSVLFSTAWLAQQIAVGALAVREARHYNDAWARFVAGQWTPDMVHYVYPNREQAVAGLAYLRANHVGWTLTPIGSAERREREGIKD